MNTIWIVQISLFITGTLFTIYISRKMFLNYKVHGFYRFFVFESVIGLIALNLPFWYTDPFSPIQLLSWILLFISLYLVIQSVITLRKAGGSANRESSETNFEFENTVNLIQSGVYRYIRHPMYASLLLLGAGTFLKQITLFSFLLTLTATIFLVLTARVEEKENIHFFGEQYSLYMRKTKMFIPFIF